MAGSYKERQRAVLDQLIAKAGSKAKLAKRADISASTLTKLLNGERRLGASVARKLAQGMGVGVGSLLSEIDPGEEKMGSMRETPMFGASRVRDDEAPDSTGSVRSAGQVSRGQHTDRQVSTGQGDEAVRIRAMRLARKRGAGADVLASLLEVEPPEGSASDPWWWVERVLAMTDAK